MFGEIEFPVAIEYDPLWIKSSSFNDFITYSRSLEGKITEKTLSFKKKSCLVINPVEPVNTPEPIASHLHIEFETPIVIEPQSNCSVFLTFPLDIGIFLKNNKESQLIDVFSLCHQKFTLYGEPTGGHICKYWRSPIYSAPPNVQPFSEGICELLVMNTSKDWHEVSKVVFSAYHMKIFYSKEMAYLKATMKILDRGLAETSFEKKKLRKGFKESLEVYRFSKLKITSTAYIMEFGL